MKKVSQSFNREMKEKLEGFGAAVCGLSTDEITIRPLSEGFQGLSIEELSLLPLCETDRIDLGGEEKWQQRYWDVLSNEGTNPAAFFATYQGRVEAVFGFTPYAGMCVPWLLGSGRIRKERPIAAMRISKTVLKLAREALGLDRLWLNVTHVLEPKHLSYLTRLGFVGHIDVARGRFTFHYPDCNLKELDKYV